MLKSMTAFAREQDVTQWGTLTWELRSVNHRYLEAQFRLPESFREIEPDLRAAQRKALRRGKVESILKWQLGELQDGGFKLNQKVIDEINKAARQINRTLDNPAHVNALEVLQWPGVVDINAEDSKTLLRIAVELYVQALETLEENRLREGEQLLPLFEDRLVAISRIVEEVRGQIPGIQKRQSQLIKDRFQEAKVELDPCRLEQEMILFAQKIDVAEELDRLNAHVKEVEKVLKKNEPVGRRLDFLMQELNREANTLSSKSVVTETTMGAVDLKVFIEQMREQVQNIE